MRRSLRYTDAVKLLAGGENQFIELLDDASATMLLGAGVFDLFEAREQALERDQRRPVAVIVTSRTAVAGRATIPADAPIIRLEPFDDDQISTWVRIWNRANSTSLAKRAASPLSTATVLRYRVLAEQPLLLLMLALYDATANALSTIDPDLSQSTVYERLLKEFARRELMKDPDVTDLDRRVEQELLRLSIVAFAMFNRGAQWIDADSLTEDLRALSIWETERRHTGFRSPLGAGQQMIGRFFFIHNVQATRDGDELQTYEFLHATFSEYLTARLVVRLLAELAAQHLASAYSVSQSVNDAMLYALLSFDCLAARAPIMAFISELIAQHDPAIREAMNTVLVKLFHGSLMDRTDRTHSDYVPAVAEVVTRAACWNANLFLLSALAQDCISLRELYPEKGHDAVYQWHRLTNLWRSCVRGEGWNGLADCLAVERTWVGHGKDIVVRVGQPGPHTTKPDMRWSYYMPDSQLRDGERWDSHSHDEMTRRANFLVDRRMDVAMHNMTPLADAFPTLGNTLYKTRDGRLVTAINLLTAALVAPYSRKPADEAITDLFLSMGKMPDKQASEFALYDELAADIIRTALDRQSVSNEAYSQIVVAAAVYHGFPEPLRNHVKDLVEKKLAATTPTPPTPEASPAPAPSPTRSSPETPATPPTAP